MGAGLLLSSSCSSLSPTPSGSIAIPERRGNAVKNGDSDTGAYVDKEHIAACKQGCKQESIFLEEKQSSDRNLGAALDRRVITIRYPEF